MVPELNLQKPDPEDPSYVQRSISVERNPELDSNACPAQGLCQQGVWQEASLAEGKPCPVENWRHLPDLSPDGAIWRGEGTLLLPVVLQVTPVLGKDEQGSQSVPDTAAHAGQ